MCEIQVRYDVDNKTHVGKGGGAAAFEGVVTFEGRGVQGSSAGDRDVWGGGDV